MEWLILWKSKDGGLIFGLMLNGYDLLGIFYNWYFSTLIATSIGTLAAIGLSSEMPYNRPIMALLISPMVVPLVIIASGLFFFFSDVGIAKTYIGVI